LRKNYLLGILCLGISLGAFAQKDNTGTNPANFTYDARFYSEMAALKDQGGSLLTSTFELRLPLGRDLANVLGTDNENLIYDLGTKFGSRIRTRYKNLNIDNPGEAPFDNSNVSGIGDLDVRVLYMAYASKKLLVVPGLEVTFNTATHDALGSGKTLLSPMLFGVFPGLLGKGSLFAPGYQYVFDISGDDIRPDVSRSQIDLYFVWVLAKGRNWLILDPQIIIDHKNNTMPALFELEWGFMIPSIPGASVYLRPGFGIGSDRPYSWNLEVGLKFIWR